MAAPLLYAGMAGLQLVGGYFAAQNARDTAALNRDIAEMNAEFAELDAYDAEIQGLSQEAQYQSVIDKTLSEQQARLTAADVDVSYGSVAEIREETDFIANLNKMEIQREAQERALGYEQQARQYRMSGSMQILQGELQASQIQTQAVLGAARTGITGYTRN